MGRESQVPSNRYFPSAEPLDKPGVPRRDTPSPGVMRSRGRGADSSTKALEEAIRSRERAGSFGVMKENFGAGDQTFWAAKENFEPNLANRSATGSRAPIDYSAELEALKRASDENSSGLRKLTAQIEAMGGQNRGLFEALQQLRKEVESLRFAVGANRVSPGAQVENPRDTSEAPAVSDFLKLRSEVAYKSKRVAELQKQVDELRDSVGPEKEVATVKLPAPSRHLAPRPFEGSRTDYWVRILEGKEKQLGEYREQLDQAARRRKTRLASLSRLEEKPPIPQRRHESPKLDWPILLSGSPSPPRQPPIVRQTPPVPTQSFPPQAPPGAYVPHNLEYVSYPTHSSYYPYPPQQTQVIQAPPIRPFRVSQKATQYLSPPLAQYQPSPPFQYHPPAPTQVFPQPAIQYAGPAQQTVYRTIEYLPPQGPVFRGASLPPTRAVLPRESNTRVIVAEPVVRSVQALPPKVVSVTNTPLRSSSTSPSFRAGV